jgi:branched-chain amino acid transport system substrate-binding protein
MRRTRLVPSAVAQFAAVLATVALSVACGSGSSANGGTKTLLFGVNTMLSGATADTGKQYSQGIELAVNDINSKGGVRIGSTTYLLKPDVCDNQSTAPQAVQCGHRLAERDNVNVMMVPLSAAALALEGFNVQDKFLIIANAGASNITTQHNPLVVRAFPDFVTPVPDFLDRTYQFLKLAGLEGAKVVAMQANNVIGQQFDDAAAAVLPQHGAQLIKRVTVDVAATDLSGVVTQALQAQPDALLLTEACLQAAQIMKAARTQGFKGSFIVYWGCDPELIAPAAGAADYHSVVGDLAWVRPSPTADAIKQQYTAKYGGAAGAGVGGGYADVQLYVAAMKIAGAVDDASAIRSAMDAAAKQPGSNVFGITGFDSAGNCQLPVIPVTFYQGKVGVLDTPAAMQAFLNAHPDYVTSTAG